MHMAQLQAPEVSSARIKMSGIEQPPPTDPYCTDNAQQALDSIMSAYSQHSGTEETEQVASVATPVTQQMLHSPDQNDGWGPAMYWTPEQATGMESITQAGKRLIVEARVDNARFASSNMTPYPDAIDPRSDKWKS